MKIVVGFLLLILLTPAVSTAAPILTFAELRHDFGTVTQQDKTEHLFEFENKGDQELVIEKVSGS